MLGLEESRHRDLARTLRAWAASHAPDWTDANDSDPGITLLELFAFVTESLAMRAGAVPERKRASATRLAKAALALAGTTAATGGGTLARNRYFYGRLLGAEDFQLEQDYFRERLRRHNRTLHGSGIVHGLQVSVSADGGGGQRVVVQPGFAIAPDGEDIAVPCEASADLPQAGGALLVMLSRAEVHSHPIPVADGEPAQFTRIEETFALDVQATASPQGLALARLIRAADGWTLDAAFAAPRARCHLE